MPDSVSIMLKPATPPVARDLTEALLASPRQRDRLGVAVAAVLAVGLVICVSLRWHGASIDGTMPPLITSPGFWLLMLAGYLLGPAADWLILRRLWRLPIAGLLPLLRKQAVNEIVLGYSGDVQFYFWARRHVSLLGSPFGTLRDMSVLSALAGNLVTLLLMAAAWPWLGAFASGPLLRLATIAVLVIVGTSLTIFMVQRLCFLFSMSRATIAMVLATNIARIVTGLIVSGALWMALVPGLAPGMVLALAALRMMLSRVPLLPGKDAVFAGGALLATGSDPALGQAVALIAALTFAAHVAIGGAMLAADMREGWRG